MDDEASQLEARPTGGEEDATSAAGHADEPHRGFVDQMNSSFARAYSLGGVSVVVLTAAVVWIGVELGGAASALVWMAAVIAFLAGLFVLRLIVSRRARSLSARIDAYCQANEVDVDTLRQRYGGGDAYPYFDSIFEVTERRQQLRNQ